MLTFHKAVSRPVRLQAIILFWGLCAICAIGFAGCGEDRAAWSKIKGTNDLEALDTFLLRFPNSAYREEAFARRGEALWLQAEKQRTVYPFLLYVRDYPQGEHYQAAFVQASSIPMDRFSATELRSRPFTGRLGSDSTGQFVRAEFRAVQEKGDSVLFTAVLNFAQVRNTLTGYVLRSDNSIRFERSIDLPGMVVQTPGRLYRRDGTLWLESTDLQQFWRIAQ
jgi:hypothetical protein